MIDHQVYVGTIGEGLFRSVDGGESFRRACEGMFVECHVRALAVHPDRPRTLYLGSEQGVFVSTDGAETWTKLPAPLAGLQVWSLLLVPRRPEIILAGTYPGRIFRSSDAGRSWTEGRARIEQACPRILHTRVTTLAANPEDPGEVWAGVEIDGVHRSQDAGQTWEPIGIGLSSRDIHSLVILPGEGPRLLAATNNDLNTSEDGGRTWKPMNVGAAMPWSYCRALAQLCGQPEVILLGSGDRPPGWEGTVGRSSDGGRTWSPARMPARSNSTIWCFAVHPASPELIYSASVSGQLYRSTDYGQSWHKLKSEFGEIRALAWAPA